MSDWSRKEFNAVDGDEGVAKGHEDSDENLQEKDCCLGKTCVFVMGLNEIEDEMSNGRYHYEPFDDHNSSEVNTSDNGSKVRDDFYHACKGNIERVRFIRV